MGRPKACEACGSKDHVNYLGGRCLSGRFCPDCYEAKQHEDNQLYAGTPEGQLSLIHGQLNLIRGNAVSDPHLEVLVDVVDDLIDWLKQNARG